MYQIKTATTAYPLLFFMVDSTDHVTGKTGLSPTVTLSKAGAAFASPSGTVTEIANGWYKVAGNATDSATLGPLALHATGTAADPCDVMFEVVAFNPQATIGVQVWDEARSGHVVAGSFGQAQQIVDNGTAQGGGANTITLRAGASSVTDSKNGNVVFILSGTGAGQNASIQSYDGSTKIATIVGSWTTNPDNTSVYVEYPAGSAGITAAQISTTIWSEVIPGSFGAGTAGYLLDPNVMAAGILDIADAVEVGLTVRNALKLVAAAAGGKLSGAGTATETIRNAVADSKNRIVASVDASGNRTAITYDVS